MKLTTRSAAAAVALIAVCAHPSRSDPRTGVYTARYNNERTAANPFESILTPANVNTTAFGRLFVQPTPGGNVWGQVLYVPDLDIPGKGTHDVIFGATDTGTAYAWDANDANGANAQPLWTVSLVPDGETAFNGVIGTPVIDPVGKTLYADCLTKQNGHAIHRLHALDITTGAEKLGGPVVVWGSVAGTGWGSLDGIVTFSENQLQRPGLLLANGVVYVCFGAMAEDPFIPQTVVPYHGWVMGYDAATLRQVWAYCDTPDGDAGGIWMSGAAPAADADGFIYLSTGNGKFDVDAGGADYGDSYIKISAISGYTIADYATPSDQFVLYYNDSDLGSSGPVLLPPDPVTHVRNLVGFCKNGFIYICNRDSMGRYSPVGNLPFSQIIQVKESNPALSTPAYFNDTLYVCGINDVPKAYTRVNGLFGTTPASQAAAVVRYPGASGGVSSNGKADGIYWVLDNSNQWYGGPGILRAYDASNLAVELYDSEMLPDRDRAGQAVRFTVPTVINGKVYVPQAGQIDVYGLLAPAHGDANHDGSINMADVAAVLSAGSGLSAPSDLGAMDVAVGSDGRLGTGDGTVDVLDAVTLLRYISGFLAD